MKRLIILFMVWASVASAQSTSSYQIVTSDGGNLYTNNVDIMETLEIVKPAYACYSIGTDPLVTASSVTVTNGTIESGTVTNTWEADGSYFVVGESGQFDIHWVHTNILGFPAQIQWEGYYDGNPSHEISLSIWDYYAGTWDEIEADAFPVSDGSEFTVTYNVPTPQTNYVVDGVATTRMYHTSSAVGSHDFATDYYFVLDAQVQLPSADTYYAISALSVCGETKRINTNTMNFTNEVGGMYFLTIGGTGTGSTNTVFEGRIFTNSVATDIFFKRTINVAGDIGNASDSGYLRIAPDTTIGYYLKGSRDDVWASFFNFHATINKIDN